MLHLEGVVSDVWHSIVRKVFVRKLYGGVVLLITILSTSRKHF